MDRGFGRCIVLRTHKSGIKRYRNGAIDRIVAPDPASLRSREKSLDSDGMAGVGQFISNGAGNRALSFRALGVFRAPLWPRGSRT